MCGRYSASRTADQLVQAFGVEDVEGVEELDGGELDASWNVAPTNSVYAVLERAPRGEPDAPARSRCPVP
jgi:putative SOS response-associated peptidase YedK